MSAFLDLTRVLNGTVYFTNQIAGVDEAGRGPLAGPVIAAAVILPSNHSIVGLADSKKLSAKRRESVFDAIVEKAVAISIGRAEVAEIDSLNILWATMLAMQRAIQGLTVSPAIALIDGNRCPEVACETQAIIGGDAIEPVISAASIIAKVTRDREMRQLNEQYPEYAFATHQGYPTKQHLAALQQHGPSRVHRRSFGPVKALLSAVTNEVES